MTNYSSFVGRGFIAASFVILASFETAIAQTSSTRLVAPRVTNWFDAAAWSNGVPNGPGDAAFLTAPNGGTLQLGSSVTLEQMVVKGRLNFGLIGTGPLVFSGDGSGSPSLDLISEGGALIATLPVPTSIANGDSLSLNVDALSTLQWSGQISSTGGTLVKQGAGAARLSGANSGWEGALVVESGSLTAANDAALGAMTTETSVLADGTLVLEQSSSKPLTLAGGTLSLKNITTSGPISLIGAGTIFRPQNPFITDRGQLFETTVGTTFIASNVSGDGDLIVTNGSRDPIHLTGQNSHTGVTYITAGRVFATNATSLGSTSGGTIVQGGELIVQAPTAEGFRIEGGQLTFAASNFMPLDSIEVAGGNVVFPNRPETPTPIIVDGPGGKISGGGGTSAWTGGSTGAGSLRISGFQVNAPLAHDGDVILENSHLNVANSYTGKTIVANNSSINHVGALGQSTTVRVAGGRLTLNVLPDANPEYVVESGDLVIPAELSPFTSPITLGGTYDATIEGGATLNGPIRLVRQTSSGRNRIASGIVNGQITGEGGLWLGGGSNSVTHLNAANNIGGRVVVWGGDVHINHSQAISSNKTVVPAGRLHLHTPVAGQIIVNEDYSNSGTVIFHAPQSFTDPWVVNSGTIEAAAEVGMTDLIMLKGQVTSSGTGAIRLDGDMRVLQTGGIDGQLRGDGDIRLLGSRLTVAGDLSNYAGDFHVQTGSLTFGYLSSGFTAPTRINASSDIHVYDGATMSWATGTSTNAAVIENNVYLHNARGGNGYSGALVMGSGNGPQIFRGRIDAGDQGSTIQGSFTLEGQLTGNNLTIGYGGVEVASSQRNLRGRLRLTDQAGLNFFRQGELHGVESVDISQGSTIYFGPSQAKDRLGDEVEVRSQGGFISLVSSSSDPTSETIGQLTLQRGSTRVAVSSDHGSLSAGLTINRVSRERGSILYFRQDGFRNTTRILDGASLQHGIIGPWAVTDDGFATLTETGAVVTKSATTFADVNDADPTDHVAITGSKTLTKDVTVASLRHNADGSPTTLDLGGHQLTVLSGGVFRSETISNGRITAGETGDAELILHRSHTVSADVVDNAGGGSVALIANATGTRLSGNNSYTGGTWIVGSEYYPGTNASVRIESLAAIPANDRVYVDNGRYELQGISSGEVALAELHIRNNGFVSGSFLAPLRVGRMVLEDGRINALLTGDGSIVKTSDGVIDFTNSTGAEFTGTITVQDGLLVAPANFAPKATYLVEGGQLTVGDQTNSASRIVLNGGALGPGRYTGPVEIQGDSQLFHNQYTLLYGKVTGSGDLTVRGRQDDPYGAYAGFFGDASQYAGDIRVESGAFRVGSPSNAGTGVISVMPAGRLILGSNHYSSPPTSIDNEIHLHGGTLYSTPPWNISLPGIASPSTLTGNVIVHDEAFIGALRNGVQDSQYHPGLSLNGQVTLNDGAHVYGLSDARSQIAEGDVALVDIGGELRVGANTTWHLLTSSLSISGVIRPNGPNGSINFVGLTELLRMKGAKLRVDAGESLAVLVNGRSEPVHLSGAGSSLAGGGALRGDYSLRDGATISPGNSPGILGINGNVTLGPLARLAIELAGTRESQFDQLRVQGSLVLDGAMLDLSLLEAFMPSTADGFVIARASSIVGRFSNASESILIGGKTLPVTYRNNMVIVGNVAAVPEPATLSLSLACFGVLTAAWKRRRRYVASGAFV